MFHPAHKIFTSEAVMKTKPSFFRRFFEEEHGNALLIFGLGIMAFMGATGSAIDMGRAQMLQSQMSSSLDAAGLAAGATASTADIQTEATKFFNVNFKANQFNATVDSIVATPNADRTLITLSAQATMPTVFMRYFGKNSVTVRADSEITRASKGMEVVMVLDITGSMAGSKMTSLRNAANDLVDALFGNNAQLSNFWIGMVPYVASVNIGSARTSWLSNYDLSRYPSNYPAGATRWKGCVEERATTNNLDYNDTPPNATDPTTLWPMYFWADNDVDNNWIQGSTISLNQNYDYSNAGARGPNVACGQPIQVFTSYKATIQTAINGLQHWRRGGTTSTIGLAWGWRLISPRWRGLWGHEQVSGQDRLPLDYNTPLMEKVIVLMTDGVNEFFDGQDDILGTNTDPSYSDYTAYGRLDDLRAPVSSTSQSTGITNLNNRMTALCNAVKANNIIIYTITFQLGNSTAHNNARTLFRSCATRPEYYFDAESQVSGSSSPDLRTVFRTIGDSLANLRISK
jgi:Flp pilus assembly protein TadG